MKKYVLNKQVFLFFLLILIAEFLVLPKIGLVQKVEDIDLREIERYLEIPEDKVESLIHSLINLFNSKWIDLMASGFSTEEERAVPNFMREAVRVQALSHLLVDAPAETTWTILKAGIKIVKIYIDPKIILEEFEKLTVKEAVKEGKRQLFWNEIRITPGVIDFKYISREGEEKIAPFQYILIYKPSSPQKGEILIRFYSSQPLEPPENKIIWGSTWAIYTELEHALPPFIVDIRGEVENYRWVGQPSMKIDFSEPVPDFGIKPLSFWEKHILKPLKTTIKEVELIITKVTGKASKISEKAAEIWEKIKSTISKFIPFSPAALVTPPEVPEIRKEQPLTVKETKEGVIQEIGEILEEETIEKKEAEIKTPKFPTSGVGERERLVEMIDDLTEEIDVLKQKVAKLAEEKRVKMVEKEIDKEKKEEIKEESKELKELAKEKKTKEKKVKEKKTKTKTKTKKKTKKKKKVYQSSGSPPPSPPSYPKILISEIQIEGDKKNHDFIELYNPNNFDVDISGYKLRKRTAGKSESLICLLPSGSIIPKKGYYLWASSEDENYPLSINADTWTKQFLAPTNSIAVLTPDNTIISALAWGSSTNPFVEKTPFPNNPGKNQSLGRIWDENKGEYKTTGDNSADFEIQNPTPKAKNRSPQNQLPIAAFTYSPFNPIVNQEITFDASSATDTDGVIINYIWDFGDGNSTTTNLATTTHFYSTSSDFIVTLLVVDNLGATSSPATTTINIIQPPSLSIVINEIAWMGTKASDWDEWIELFNNTTSSIDLAGWKIRKGNKDFIIISTSTAATTTIPAGGFYLLERAEKAVSDIPADFVYGGRKLMENNPKCEILSLYDTNNKLIDQTVCLKNGDWPAGQASPSYISMERISATTTGATSTNWASNNLITRKGKDAKGYPINGTPKAENSVSKTETIVDIQNFSSLFDEFSQITFTYLGSPYKIYGSLVIPEEKTLKIEPGVVMKFQGSGESDYNNSDLKIEGTLLAKGTSTKEILFTSIFEPSGSENWWGQIYFASSSQNSQLEFVRIKYGGKKQTNAYILVVDGSSVLIKNSIIENFNQSGIKLINSSSTIENSTIQNTSSGEAITISGGNPIIKNSTFKNTFSGMFIKEGSTALIEGNTFSEINYSSGPIVVQDSYPIFRNNTATDNLLNGIYLFGTINQKWTLTKDLPYFIPSLTVATTSSLQIEPGVEFRLYPQAILTINGTMEAIGSSTNEIIFQGLDETTYWNRIEFNSPATSTLKYVKISQGGNAGQAFSQGMVYVKGTVDLQFLTLQKTSYYGLNFYNSPQSRVLDSKFEKTQIGIKITGQCPLMSGLEFIDVPYPFSRNGVATTSTDPSSICQ